MFQLSNVSRRSGFFVGVLAGGLFGLVLGGVIGTVEPVAAQTRTSLASLQAQIDAMLAGTLSVGLARMADDSAKLGGVSPASYARRSELEQVEENFDALMLELLDLTIRVDDLEDCTGCGGGGPPPPPPECEPTGEEVCNGRDDDCDGDIDNGFHNGEPCETEDGLPGLTQFCECLPFPSCNGECGSGEACCDDDCADLATDTQNCGGCGNVCPDGAVCSGGACVGM